MELYIIKFTRGKQFTYIINNSFWRWWSWV